MPNRVGIRRGRGCPCGGSDMSQRISFPELHDRVGLIRQIAGHLTPLRTSQWCVVLRRYPHGSGGVLRLFRGGQLPVIAKVRRRGTLRERLRHAMSIGSAQQEWRMQMHAALAGLPVALPLAISETKATDGSVFDVLVMEDLGDVRGSGDHLRSLLTAGDEASAVELEDRIIALTRSMLEAGIVDGDHHLQRLVVRESDGAIHRLGFREARRFRGSRPPQAALVVMLERLIRSHQHVVHAVHGSAQRSDTFTSRLMVAAGCRPATEAKIRALNDQELRRELDQSGIDCRPADGIAGTGDPSSAASLARAS